MVKYLHKKANDDPVSLDLIPGADVYAEPPGRRQGRPLEGDHQTEESGRRGGSLHRNSHGFQVVRVLVS